MDPRAKLFLLLEANLLLFCHVNTRTEALLTALFLLPLFLSGRIRSGVRFTLIYGALLALSLIEPPTEGRGAWLAIFPMIFLLPLFLSGRIRSGVRFTLIYGALLALSLIEPPTEGRGAWLAIFPMIAVGIRMLLPCLITGAFAFTTTSPGEFTAALRRMHVPEAVIIPCIVVIRFFPTLREDYRHIRNAMALRGIPSGGGSPLRHPAQSLEYIIVPLLMNATVVAQDLSVAAMTKGLGNPGRHTSMGSPLRHPAQSLEYIIVPLLMNATVVAQDLSVAAMTKGLGNPGRHTSMTDIRIGIPDWAIMILCALPLILFLTGVL